MRAIRHTNLWALAVIVLLAVADLFAAAWLWRLWQDRALAQGSEAWHRAHPVAPRELDTRRPAPTRADCARGPTGWVSDACR